MAASRSTSRFLWTAGTIGGSFVLRFGQNIVLARLLAPELLGVLVVVYTVRLGIELLTDVGIEQNIVHHRDGLTRAFRDTAWTMQALRGLLLSGVFLAASPFLATVYGIDQRIFLLAACAPALGALHSTAIFALVKQLEVRRRSLFELGCEALAVVFTLALTWVWRSVWAPVVGLVVAAALRSALSYYLPDAAQRFALDRGIVRRIVHFGKWIAVTSLLMYAATFADRLFLGGVVPLAVLGVYGIARAIAELPTTLARRIGYQVVFPALSSGESGGGRAASHPELTRTRLLFALAACGAIAVAAGLADVLIALIYDPRYHAAGWMLAVLLLGGVFAILSNLNEALLLAAGRPAFSSLANVLRLLTLALGLGLGFAGWGLAGAVVAVAGSEACFYLYVALGQLRLVSGYWKSDAAVLAASAGLFAAVLALREALGWGSPFAGFGGA